MKFNNLKQKINVETLFYIAYTLFILYSMFSNVKFLSDYRNIVIKIVYVMLILIFIIQSKKYSIKSMIIVIVLSTILITSWIVSKSNTLIPLLLFILASKNMEFKKIVNYSWKLKTIFLFLIIGLYFLGFTDNYYMYREDGTLRSSMGFSHPNAFGIYILSICCEYIYVRYPKLKFIEALSIIGLSFLVSNFSDSRTSQILLIILVLMVMFLNKRKIEIIFANRFINKIVLSLFIIITIVSLGFAYNYNPNNEFMYKVNKIVSGRIRLANIFLDKYSVNLFGNDLEIVTTKQSKETGEQTQVLDNAYIKIILCYGVSTYLLFALGVYCNFKKAIDSKDYIFCIIFIIYLLLGITENALYYLYENIFLIYISIYLYNKNQIKENFEKTKLNVLYKE